MRFMIDMSDNSKWLQKKQISFLSNNEQEN